MTKLHKEPLFHFLLMGGALFLLFQFVAGGSEDENAQIVISEGRVQALMQSFGKVRQRPPSQEELDNLVQSYIREEVLYREALAMGLEKDDLIVRRRLTQKIAFLSEDMIALDEPDDAVLEAYLRENEERFRLQVRYSFRQVYLNAGKRRATLDTDIKEVLKTLRAQEPEDEVVGDSLMVKNSFTHASASDVARVLGERFVAGLDELTVGNNWQGPVPSGFGVHLVYLSERIEARAPSLEQVRADVVREWSAQQRQQANDKFFEILRARYQVTLPTGLSPAVPVEAVQ